MPLSKAERTFAGWTLSLEQKSKKAFNNATDLPWTTLEDGKHVGTVRSIGEGAGDFAFVKVFEAGHMVRIPIVLFQDSSEKFCQQVPYDQPAAALDMFQRWIANIPLHKNGEK